MIGAQSGIPDNVADGSKIMGYPAVGIKEFFRNYAYTRRLGELFAQVRKLQSQVDSLSDK